MRVFTRNGQTHYVRARHPRDRDCVLTLCGRKRSTLARDSARLIHEDEYPIGCQHCARERRLLDVATRNQLPMVFA